MKRGRGNCLTLQDYQQSIVSVENSHLLWAFAFFCAVKLCPTSSYESSGHRKAPKMRQELGCKQWDQCAKINGIHRQEKCHRQQWE